MGGRRAEQSGFSLIELVIVVALVLLIAAISLPNLLNARKRASQASAIASIKAIDTAESIYRNTYPAKGYSPSLINLGNNGSTCETTSASNACVLDPLLSAGMKDGYIFDLVGDGNLPDESYTLTATPESSAECTYSSDQSGNIQPVPISQPKGLSAGAGSAGNASCGMQ